MNWFKREQWALLFFLSESYDDLDDMNTQLLKLSIDSFGYHMSFTKIMIFCSSYSGNQKIFNMSHMNDIEVTTYCRDKFAVIDRLLSSGLNVIVSNRMMGMSDCVGTTKSYAQMIPVDDGIYNSFGHDYGFTRYINSNAMVIINSDKMKSLIQSAQLMASKLAINNAEVNDNIALTIVNKTNHFCDMDDKKIVCYKNNRAFYDSFCELKALTKDKSSSPYSKKNYIDWRSLISKQIKAIGLTNDFRMIINYELMNPPVPYNDPNYIYYPFIDIEAPKYQSTDLLNIFNTNGMVVSVELDNVFNLFYKRFFSPRSGLFIRKKSSKTSCPKKIHLLNGSNAINFTGEDFALYSWNDDQLNDMVAESRWAIHYNKNPQLIRKLVLIDTHGGLVVESSWRIITSELFQNQLSLSFEYASVDPNYSFIAGMNSDATDYIWNALYDVPIDGVIKTAPGVIIYPGCYFDHCLGSSERIIMSRLLPLGTNKSIVDYHQYNQ